MMPGDDHVPGLLHRAAGALRDAVGDHPPGSEGWGRGWAKLGIPT